MANNGNNFTSLLYCFFKNGQYVTFPLFQDVASTQIIYVRNQPCPNAAGVLVNAFMVYAQDPKSLNFDIYYCTPGAFPSEPTLLALQSALNDWTQQNSFTLYTGLQNIGAFDVLGDLNGPILISDLWTNNRIFDGNNTTFIYLNVQTDLMYLRIAVSGDQTTSANYYYDYYL